MKSFNGNIVGRANYTLRDYYHDILFYSKNKEITSEEKEALDWLNIHDLCKCGHEKTAHSKRCLEDYGYNHGRCYQVF